MRGREAVAWGIVLLVVFVLVSHWTAVKTWWKYRNEIDQAAGLLEQFGGSL